MANGYELKVGGNNDTSSPAFKLARHMEKAQRAVDDDPDAEAVARKFAMSKFATTQDRNTAMIAYIVQLQNQIRQLEQPTNDANIDTLISIWSCRPQPGTTEGKAWESGARQGYTWGRGQVPAGPYAYVWENPENRQLNKKCKVILPSFMGKLPPWERTTPLYAVDITETK